MPRTTNAPRKTLPRPSFFTGHLLHPKLPRLGLHNDGNELSHRDIAEAIRLMQWHMSSELPKFFVPFSPAWFARLRSFPHVEKIVLARSLQNVAHTPPGNFSIGKPWNSNVSGPSTMTKFPKFMPAIRDKA